MTLHQKIKPDFEFEDNRGYMSQLVHSGFEQVNVLVSKKGVNRGGHFHKISREAFYVVSGHVHVYLKRGDESENLQFSSGDFFLIQPYIVHSMWFDEDCILVVLYDRPIEKDDGSKDIYIEKGVNE